MRKIDKTNFRRRELLSIGGALAGGAIASLALPVFSAYGQGEKPIKLGMIDPMTGTYAALGAAEFNGAQMAVDELNARKGVLGRPLQLFKEDSSAKPGLAVQKAKRLIDREDVNMFLGGVSSAVALSISKTAHAAGRIYIDTGGHADGVTGDQCNWSTFRTCMSTWLLCAGTAKTIFEKYGKKWYFITPDYAYGHSVQADYEKLLKQLGGTVAGVSLAPLGATDYSSFLIAARAAKPDVLMMLMAGDDGVNCLKQASEFKLFNDMKVAGGLLELEQVSALPSASRVGLYTFEWWWDQPNVPEVKDFVARYRKRYNEYPSARSWFGFGSIGAYALAVEEAKTLEAVKVARELENLVWPAEIALQPGKCKYRQGDHQMLANSFPSELVSTATEPQFMVKPLDVVSCESLARPVAETGCKMTYPT